MADLVLGRLLEESHLLAPDTLAAAVDRHVEAMGAREVTMYLADLDQVLLVPVTSGPGPEKEALEIDATLAGRAFRQNEVLESVASDGCRLWLPLLDGGERLGVLEVVVEGIGESVREDFEHLATLVAELVVTKSQYGDVLTLARRREEMNLSAEMQWALLPPLSFRTPELEISGLLAPPYRMGGDAFDYAVNGGIAHLAILDAMGHGVEASLLAALALGSYRHGRRRGLDLVETFEAMSRALAEHFGPDRFVTAQLVELEWRTGALRWINAGHPLPLLVRGGKVVRALSCAPTMPAGIGHTVAEVADERLEPGDRVLFFSDGVIEARSADGEPFGTERLADLLGREGASGQPLPETMRRLSHAVRAHHGAELQDDATMLFLEWRGPAAGRCQVQVRMARPDEYEALGALTESAYAQLSDELLSGGYAEELRDVASRANSTEVLVAVGDDGRVLGGLSYVPGLGPLAVFDEADSAGIRMLAVDPAARRAGVGSTLVEAAVQRARAAGRRRVVLHTTEHMKDAHRLYERFGFRRAPERDLALDILLLAYVLVL